MAITQIADAKTDREHWLDARLNYLTSSDFYTWIGDTPRWWSDTRSSIISAKREGTQKEFEPEVAVSVEHGSFDEEHIMQKFAIETGARVLPTNALTVNDRWPGLAASIDGIVDHCFAPDGEFRFAQNKFEMQSVANDMERLCQWAPMVCEIKKSTSKGWSDGKVSEWYLPQVQGQLHILEMDYAVIVADTILRKGPRLFWNLTAKIVAKDPEFEKVMDRLSEEFLTVMGREAK